MKRLLTVAILVLCPSVLTAQISHMKTTQSGAFAVVGLSPDPFTTINLQVSRSTTGGSTNTQIVFFEESFSPDFQNLIITQIFGSIPDSAFTGDNTGNLVLSLDTSTLDPTNSTSETCTLDLSTFIQICGAAAPGLIQLSFQENSANRTQVLHSETVTTVGNITIRTRQSSDNGSANVTGSVFGTSISSATATVGVNHQSSLEITRTDL